MQARRHLGRERTPRCARLWAGLVLSVASAGCTASEQSLFEPRAAPIVAGGAAMAGAPLPADAGLATSEFLDPNARFDWRQTVPGQGSCTPGTYSGRFGCELDGTLVSLLLGPSGTVKLTLGSATEQQVLPVARGSLEGLFRGTVQGTLDCGSNELHARSNDGRALQLDGLTGASDMIVSFPTFTATLDGTLDRATQVISGAFRMTNESGETCAGTFQANAMP